MNSVERVVRGYLEEPREERPKQQVGTRVSALLVEVLDATAERLKMTRSGLASELLEAAIEDAGHLVGVEVLRDDTGEEIVGLFDNPMEKQ